MLCYAMLGSMRSRRRCTFTRFQPFLSLCRNAASQWDRRYRYVGFTIGEAVADAQMLRFQAEKRRRERARQPAGAYARGFIESGMWAYSRHPNYFCELGLWWAFYLFSVAAGQPPINFSILGPFFVSLLFVPPHSSLDVTEYISSRKYKAYAEYQRRVSRLVPRPPASRPASAADGGSGGSGGKAGARNLRPLRVTCPPTAHSHRHHDHHHHPPHTHPHPHPSHPP